VGDGYYTFTAKHSGKCLDVKGGVYANGTAIQQYPHVDNNQTFKLVSTQPPAAATVTSIKVATMPAKTVYNAGEAFDPAGLTLAATYSDGTTKTITSGFTCDTALFDFIHIGTNEISTSARGIIDVTYEGKTTSFRVGLGDLMPQSISVSTASLKTKYIVGESVDIAGLVVEGRYEDGKVFPLSTFNVSPKEFTTIGKQTITVTWTYGGEITKTTTYDVEVTGNSTTGNLNGIVLTATMTDIGVKFDWAPNENYYGYRIYRSKTPGVEGISITDFPITAKDGPYAGQYVDVNIDPDTQYYYTIREVLAEASFDRETIEITHEQLGPASEELAVFTSAFIVEPPDLPPTGGPELKKNFMLMTIGSDTMLVNDDVKEVDPGRGTAPVIKDGRTLTPIRTIIETMGGNVGWTAADSKVKLNAYDSRIEMWIGSKRLLRNGADREMDIAPAVINDRTMLPLRFVSDNITGIEIAWIGSSKQVVIVYYTFEK